MKEKWKIRSRALGGLMVMFLLIIAAERSHVIETTIAVIAGTVGVIILVSLGFLKLKHWIWWISHIRPRGHHVAGLFFYPTFNELTPPPQSYLGYDAPSQFSLIFEDTTFWRFPIPSCLLHFAQLFLWQTQHRDRQFSWRPFPRAHLQSLGLWWASRRIKIDKTACPTKPWRSWAHELVGL